MDRSPSRERERRRFLLAALVLFGVLAGLVAVTATVARSQDPQAEPAPTDGGRTVATGPDTVPKEGQPGIIPRPNQGRGPQRPGDRGGWEQLATLAAVVSGIGLLVLLVWRSSRRARTKARRPPEPTADGARRPPGFNP